MFCPDCWNKLPPPETGTGTQKAEYFEGLLKCLRLMLIVGLVLAGIALVLLAFVFAACSHMGNI